MKPAIAMLLLAFLLTGCGTIVDHFYCYAPGDNTGFPDRAAIEKCQHQK
jgi:uncharacterized protein YceK